MNTFETKQRAIFLEVHTDLPQEAPGNQASTIKAFSNLNTVAAPDILDIACGPGMQTLHLAQHLPQANITAIDLHPGYVAQAQERFCAAGVQDRVTVEQQDMTNLPYKGGSFDVIWSEGAVYIMGAENAMRQWKDLLKPNGFLVFTDNVWRVPEPAAEIHSWWMDAYPDMCTLPHRCRQAQACGYQVIESFVLPEEAWWENYYTPMEARILALRDKYSDDSEVLSILDSCVEEIDHFRRYSDCYGYAFFVLKRR